MKWSLPSLDLLVQGAKRAAARFPVVLFVAFVGTVAAIITIGQSVDRVTKDMALKVLFAADFTFLITLTVALAAERYSLAHKKALIAQVVSLVVFPLYYIFLPDQFEQVPSAVILFFVLLDIAAFLAVFSVPFFNKPQEQRGLWRYQLGVCAQAAFVAIYAAVFYLGVAAILVSLDYLFGVNIPGELYAQVWIFVVGIVGVWMFLARIPNLNSLEQQVEPFKFLTYLFQYILFPCLFVYTVILYAYGAKILITWQWPEGGVVYLILIYVIIGVLSLWMLGPLKFQPTEQQWVRRVAAGFYGALIPLMALYGVAIGMRIDQYGITENRYFVVAFAVVAVATALYMLASKEKKFLFVPCALIVAILISSCGPWSAFSMSKNSQANRLEEVLVRNNILVDGRVKDEGMAKTLSAADVYLVSDQVRYLVSVHGSSVMQPWFSDETVAKINQMDVYSQEGLILDMLGVSGKYSNYDFADQFNFVPDWKNGHLEVVSVGGYTHVINNVWWWNYSVFGDAKGNGSSAWSGTVQGEEFVFEGRDGVFFLKSGAQEKVALDLNALAARLIEKRDKGLSAAFSQEDLSIAAERDGVKIKFILSGLSGEKKDGKIVIHSVQGTLLLGLGR